MNLDEVSGSIIDAAMKVHSVLGPGLLESAYEACLVHELRSRGIEVVSQLALPIVYDSHSIDAGYHIDLLVENLIIVELKAVDALNSLHQAQVLSYLKMSRKQVGLLINFNVLCLREGIKRIVNNYQKPPRFSASSAV